VALGSKPHSFGIIEFDFLLVAVPDGRGALAR
jgi:hypothetical protein